MVLRETEMTPKRILHCLRAPVGGLFRHVCDLAIEQARRGHLVGVLCDETARDTLTNNRLESLSQHLELGLHQTPMARSIGLSDISAYQRARDLIEELRIDVAHGPGPRVGLMRDLRSEPSRAGGWMSQRSTHRTAAAFISRRARFRAGCSSRSSGS